jgi:hypothetical protein
MCLFEQDANHDCSGPQLKVGSAVSATEGTGAIGKNCARGLMAIGGYLTSHHFPRCDWSRRVHRRACIHLVRHQQITGEIEPTRPALLPDLPVPLSRAARAHTRLAWTERFARNARDPSAMQVRITLFGVPNPFATSPGLAIA